VKVALLILGLLVAAGSPVSGEVLLAVSLDWMMSLRVGVELPVSAQVALRTDWGASLFGTVVGDLFCVLHAMPRSSPLRIALLLGASNVSIVPSVPAAILAPGASVLAGYRFSERFGVDVRFGAGYPLFLERGKPVIRGLEGMPLGLWPDATLSAWLRV
jgi:hypothetical protein